MLFTNFGLQKSTCVVSESRRTSSVRFRSHTLPFALALANCCPCQVASLGLASEIMLIPARKLLLPSSSDSSLSAPSLIRVKAVFLRLVLTFFRANTCFLRDATLSPEVDLSSLSFDFDDFLSLAFLAFFASSLSFLNLAFSASLSAYHSSGESRPTPPEADFFLSPPFFSPAPAKAVPIAGGTVFSILIGLNSFIRIIALGMVDGYASNIPFE